MSKKKSFRPWVPTGRTPPPVTWLLYGSYFRLPITVKWGSYSFDYCQVRLHPLPLLKIQRAAVEKILSENCLGRDGDGWSFHRDGLGLVAVPVKGEPDPETLVRWNPDDLIYELPPGDDWSGMACNGRFSAETAQRVRKLLNSFVDRVGLAGFEDFGELEAFYYLLCNFMMRYLQSGTEAVDLVFCRLFPTPCKPQWIAWRDRPWDLWRWGKKSKVNLWMTTRAGRHMGAQHLFHKKGKTHDRKMGWRWRIGVIASQRWKLTERQHETKLMEVLGEFGYAKLNYERTAKVWPHLHHNLEEWLEAKSEPALSDALARFQNVTIRPRSGKIHRGYRGGAHFKSAVQAAQADQSDRPPKVGKKNAPMPKVPDLQPAEPDLRDAGGADPNAGGD